MNLSVFESNSAPVFDDDVARRLSLPITKHGAVDAGENGGVAV